MNPLKGTGAKKGSITIFIGSTLLVVVVVIGFMGMVSTPQMIVSVNAQSEEASERACPVPGYTLSRGECTAEPTTTTLTCEPSSVAGIPVQQSGSACIAIGLLIVLTEEVCDEIEGSTFDTIVPPPPRPGAPPPPPPAGVCEFPATETISCPGDVVPTEEGECITKPGRGNDPRT